MRLPRRLKTHGGKRVACFLLAVVCATLYSLLPAWPITGAGAQQLAPRVHEIAFERNGEIYRMNVDGDRQLRFVTGPSVEKPAWSHANSDAEARIAFSVVGEVITIWTMAADGTGDRELVTTPERDADGLGNFDPAYSPDGKKIAYTRKNFVENSTHVYLIRFDALPDEDEAKPLTTGLPSSFEPAWSPDGTKIAFASGEPGTLKKANIYVVASAGGPAVRLTHVHPEDAVGSRRPVFSADGRKIAYSKGGDIYVINVDGTGETNLTNTPNLIEDHPTYSPDNTRIAFAARAARGATPFIYIMDSDGQNVVNTNEVGDSPAWKPIPGIPIPPPSEEPPPSPKADVAVQLTASPNPVSVGQDLTYTLTVTNSGPQAAQTIRAVFQRGESTQFVSATPAQGSCAPEASPVMTRCDLGQLAAGAQTSIQVVVRPTAAGQLDAFAAASSPEDDPDLSNNGQHLLLNVLAPTPEADVAVQLTASTNSPFVGENLTYTLVVTNNGPAVAENVQAGFVRSASLQLVSATPSQGTCETTGANPLNCQLGHLAAGAQASVIFVVRPTVAEEVVLFGGATAQTPDNIPNNSQQLRLNVRVPCATEVTGQVQKFISRPGNQSRRSVRHTILVRNNSGRTLNGTVYLVFEGLHHSIEGGDSNPLLLRTRCAQPLGSKYITTVAGRDRIWRPGEFITGQVEFFNPERVPVNYTLRVYNGPRLP